jgi:hypothetical protein
MAIKQLTELAEMKKKKKGDLSTKKPSGVKKTSKSGGSIKPPISYPAQRKPMLPSSASFTMQRSAVMLFIWSSGLVRRRSLPFYLYLCYVVLWNLNLYVMCAVGIGPPWAGTLFFLCSVATIVSQCQKPAQSIVCFLGT